MQSILLTVSGKVQGIGFRNSCLNIANQLKLKGYAKNLPNNKVEILLQGKKEDIDNFLSRLNSVPLARISSIKKEKINAEPFSSFQIL